MKKLSAGKKLILPLSMAVIVSSGLAGCGERSLEERLDSARQFANAQNTDAAVIEYKNAIKSNPNAAEPRFELGQLYIQRGDFESAEKELNRALELGMPASKVIPLLSVSYQRTGAENALAEVDFKVDGMTAVESAEVGFYKLQALVELEKKDEAMALIDELSALETDSVYKGLILSYRDILSDDLDAALSQTKALREQSPANKDVLQQLGRLALAKGDRELAIDAFSEYVKDNKDDVTSQFALITLLIEAGKMAEAKPMVTQLLARNPEHPLLNQYRGIIAAGEEEYELAISHLRKAIQGGQNNPAVKLVAGYSAYQMQDYELASDYLSEVAPSLPDTHPALRMLADSLLQMGQSESATSVLNRVSGSGQGDSALFSKAGYQLLREGNVVDAKAMVEKSSELSDTAQELTRLGVLQLSLNDVGGLVNLEAAVDKAPESVVAKRTLLNAYMATGKLDKAKALAEEQKLSSPDDPAPLLYLAEVAFKQGDKVQAQQYIDQAEALAPDLPEVELVKARLLINEGKIAEAASVLDRMLSNEPANVEALTLLYTLAVQTDVVDKDDIASRVDTQLKQAEENLGLRLLAARIAFSDNQFEETLSLLAPIEPQMNTPQVFFNLKGQALMRLNRALEAEVHYQQWLDLYPQDKNAVLGMLLLKDAMGKYDDGLALTGQFLKKRPDSQISLLRAYFLTMKRQAKEAEAIIEPLPDKVKALPFVRGISARIHLLNGNGEAAMEDAQIAYDNNPNAQNTVLVVAAYESTGQAEKAMSFLNRHLEKHPEDVRSAMLLAERLIERDPQAAKQAYEALLEKTPDNFVVLNNLAYLYFEDKEMEKALPLARKAVGIQPKNADSVDTLAQILIFKDKNEEALSLYETVINDTVRSDEVYLNYVQLLLDMNRKEVARRKLRGREFYTKDGEERAERMRIKYSL